MLAFFSSEAISTNKLLTYNFLTVSQPAIDGRCFSEESSLKKSSETLCGCEKSAKSCALIPESFFAKNYLKRLIAIKMSIGSLDEYG